MADGRICMTLAMGLNFLGPNLYDVSLNVAEFVWAEFAKG